MPDSPPKPDLLEDGAHAVIHARFDQLAAKLSKQAEPPISPDSPAFQI